ncbi:hypothetical protein NA57DRAFT_7355, partial [Rhizodiscina lignyota]
MPEQEPERGSRRHYARLICRNCRSRKIKCELPDADCIEPSSVPQTAERSCKRCHNFDLECIVERTILGRPAAKRPRPNSSTAIEPRGQDEGETPQRSGMEIDGYIFSEAADDGFMSRHDNRSRPLGRPSKQDLFQSIIDPANLFSSILAKDQGFGTSITPASSQWNKPLPDVIDNDLAASLDKRLVWQRFFIPQIPTLVNIRHRLTTGGNATENLATNLLFALLCLIALETPSILPRQPPELIRRVRLAVSTYGQVFIFDPPKHSDSVLACLLLADYKPTALAGSQIVAHKAVKSSLFIHMAYRVAERLGLMSTPTNLGREPPRVASLLESSLIDSLQGLQVYFREAFMDGFVAKPLQEMHHLLNCVKPHVDTYSSVLQNRPCSPRTFYCAQSTMADYILMKSLINLKQSWNEPGNLTAIIEDVERENQHQIEQTSSFYTDSSDYMSPDEHSAVLCLLELRYHTIFVTVWGMGLLYAAVLKARLKSGGVGNDAEIYSQEVAQLTNHVLEGYKDDSDSRAQNISMFMKRFGIPYPAQVEVILEEFVDCSKNLKLGGVQFRPPRYLVLEIVKHCKNLLENNILQLKGFGVLHVTFEKQLELFAQCVHAFESMAASPWNSIDAAYANGCIYAAASKMISGLRNLMLGLKTRRPEGDSGQQPPETLQMPTSLDDLDVSQLDFVTNDGNWWPSIEFDVLGMMQEQPDQSFDPNLFPEFD